MKKIASVTFSVVVAASLIPTSFAAHAASYNSQLQQINEQQHVLQNDINNTNQKIESMTAKVEDKQVAIGKLQDQVTQLKKDIEKVSTRIKKRQVLLKARVKAMYENGGTGTYLDVLLGSKDFDDFVNRARAMYVITKQDQDMIKAQEADQKLLKNKQELVNEKLQKSQQNMDELQNMLSELKSESQKKQEMMAGLNEKAKKINQAAARAAARAAAERAQVQTQSSHTQASTVSAPSSRSNDSAYVSHTSSTSSSSSSDSSSVSLPASSMSGSIQDVIRSGYQWIGRSTYVFGGGRTAYDIAHGRFDCSGFVYWAFKNAGISLGSSVPSTSSLVYMGRPVSPSDMKPGDLVFFNTYKTNGHVGIYIGNGRFIGCQDSTGVAIASMSNPYWSAHFSGVVRRVVG